MSNVRFATIEDVKSLSSILAKTWKAAYYDYISHEYLENISEENWVPFFTETINKNSYKVVICNLEGENTGCITFGEARGDITCNTEDSCDSSIRESSPNSNNKSCCTSDNNESKFTSSSKEAEIISLYVLPEFWSSKQGYELIKFAIDNLKSEGYSKCYLWALEENTRARTFYEKVGFVCEDTKITINLDGQEVIDVRYSINLY